MLLRGRPPRRERLVLQLSRLSDRLLLGDPPPPVCYWVWYRPRWYSGLLPAVLAHSSLTQDWWGLAPLVCLPHGPRHREVRDHPHHGGNHTWDWQQYPGRGISADNSVDWLAIHLLFLLCWLCVACSHVQNRGKTRNYLQKRKSEYYQEENTFVCPSNTYERYLFCFMIPNKKHNCHHWYFMLLWAQEKPN